MSTIQEIGTLVRLRRKEIGMTQAALAAGAGLSRMTINQLEMGALSDLSFNRTSRMLELLGLSLASLDPAHQSIQAAPKKHQASALEIAARSAGVSFKRQMSAETLEAILVGSAVPPEYLAHASAVFDELPIQILARVVDEIHDHTGMRANLIWRRMRALAATLKSDRQIWK